MPIDLSTISILSTKSTTTKTMKKLSTKTKLQPVPLEATVVLARHRRNTRPRNIRPTIPDLWIVAVVAVVVVVVVVVEAAVAVVVIAMWLVTCHPGDSHLYLYGRLDCSGSDGMTSTSAHFETRL